MPGLLRADIYSAHSFSGGIRYVPDGAGEGRSVMKVLASNATIPVERALNLLEIWRTRNFDADRLLKRSRISKVLLSSSKARLSQSQFSSFFNSAALLGRDESWG